MTLPVRRTRTNDMDRLGSHWDPFEELKTVSQQLSELIDRPWWPTSGNRFVPPADLEETDDAFLVEIELPGINRNDIDVELTGRRLTVRGERKERERVGVLRRRTRRIGQFHYEVTLPDEVSGDDIEAQFADGLLTIRAPKAEGLETKRIRVS